MDKKAIIILSGGLDSSTLAYYLKDKGYELEAISFNYGQKHVKELQCAKSIALQLEISHTIVDLSFLGRHLNSALTNDNEEVPEGHYEAENMKRTVVPHRNMLMATIANAIGISHGINRLALGVHAGDHYIYPDCRIDFVSQLEYTLKKSSDNYQIELLTPFEKLDKGDIVKLGLNLGVPYYMTWTCYKGGGNACGKCGSCQERLEAFQKAKSTDPLSYEPSNS